MNVARLSRVAALLFVFVASWLFGYTSPQGPYAGLAADDFFYLARAWRLLAGELPGRDFVDPGAPLTLAMAAAAQQFLGRGAWSEVVVSATALALGTTLTSWIAFRVSGSTLAGLIAGVLPVALGPRLFSYPAILVLSLVISGLVGYARRPDWRWRAWLALITAVGFLFRHDLALFAALAVLTCMACLGEQSPTPRRRAALSYVAMTLALLAPYLAFVQMNAGLGSHFATAFGWVRSELAAAPLTWPDFSAVGAAAYCLLHAVPFMAATLVARSAASRPILIALIVLAIALNLTAVGGQSSNRLADASVPHAVLLAWTIIVWARAALGRVDERAATRLAPAARAAAAAATFVVIVGALAAVAQGLERPARRLRLLDAPSSIGDVVRNQTYKLMVMWPLESWSQRLDSGPMRMAFYLRDCTLPTQSVFVADDLPQLTALADRPFAGGHPHLRPGFFTTRHDQEAIVARLEREQVKLVMAPIPERYQRFRESYPLLDAYLSARYERLLTRVRDPDVYVDLLVRKDPTSAGWDIIATGWYEPMRWPCFRQWHSQNFTD